MSANSNDQVLVERVKQGDKRAFDLLVLKYQHKIVNLVQRYVRDPLSRQPEAMSLLDFL